MRQPDRLQGESVGGGNGAPFCHMCDRLSKSDIAWLTLDKSSVGSGRRGRGARDRVKGREYESQHSKSQKDGARHGRANYVALIDSTLGFGFWAAVANGIFVISLVF